MSKETYHIWAKGDETPDSMPEGCEFLGHDNYWGRSNTAPHLWNRETITVRRWPAKQQKQRPTAYGLLSTEEQEELREAHEGGGGVEFLLSDGVTWGHKPSNYSLIGNSVYRIKEPKEQETLEFKVTMNGKPVNPGDFSAESWANFRK